MDDRMSLDKRRDVLLVAFLGCATAVATARTRHPNGDWSFFIAAADSITSHRALLIYADFPDIQTGPLTIVVARLLDPFGYLGFRLAITLTCMAVVIVLVRSGRGLPRVRTRLALGGVVLTQLWPRLSFFGHLDDALVLLLAVCCVASARSDRIRLAAVLAGLAIAMKPWALFLLVLAVPRRADRSPSRVVPLMIGAGIVVAVWSPFVLATPKTLAGLRPKAAIASDSVLALFGLTNPQHAAAVRVVQLVAVLGVSLLVQRDAARRGCSWPALQPVWPSTRQHGRTTRSDSCWEPWYGTCTKAEDGFHGPRLPPPPCSHHHGRCRRRPCVPSSERWPA